MNRALQKEKKEEQISAKENTRVFWKEFEKSGICWNKFRNFLEKPLKFWEQFLEKNGKIVSLKVEYLKEKNLHSEVNFTFFSV